MPKTIVSELQDILDLKPKAGETQLAFSERLARKANDMDEDDWQSLEQDTQIWVNAALTAIEKKQAIPLPEGIATVVAESPEAEEAPKPKKEAKAKPVAKAKPGAAPKKEAPKKSNAGPKGKFSAEDKIEVVPEKNPFREGSKCFVWFGKIEDGMTVAEAITAGAPRHHIRWAHTLGHLKIG